MATLSPPLPSDNLTNWLRFIIVVVVAVAAAASANANADTDADAADADAVSISIVSGYTATLERFESVRIGLNCRWLGHLGWDQSSDGESYSSTLKE